MIPVPAAGVLAPGKIFSAFLALVVALGTPALHGQSLEGRFLDAAIDSLVAEHLAHGDVAGLTVAVSRGGTLLHHEPYGSADLELDGRTPREAVYEIGSVTKQFTAVLVLQLVEEGVLDLDADMTAYYPGFDTGGRRLPLRRLLDHTSGMRSYTEMDAFGELAALPLPRDSLVTLVERHPWDFEPGTALIYNNSAYFLLGLVLEEVTGSPYEELVRDRIFEPLGMSRSHYCDPARVVKGRAHGYQAGPDGFVRAPYLDHRWPYAAGSLCSTAEDLLRWNQALHGGEVLSPEMYDLLITPEPLEDGTPVHYAKGLVHQEGPFGQAIRHDGGIFGYRSEARGYPDEELAVVVLQTTAGPRGPGAVVEGIEELLLARRELPEVASPAGLDALAGSYAGPARGQPLSVTVSVRGDTLLVASGDGEPRPLTYRGDGIFGGYSTRTWFVDARGRVWGTPGAGKPVEMRWDTAAGHYVLSRGGT